MKTVNIDLRKIRKNRENEENLLVYVSGKKTAVICDLRTYIRMYENKLKSE